MDLFTSYWNSPLLPEVDAVKVSASRGDPRRQLPFKYRKLWTLCPSRETFGIEDTGEARASYREGLDSLGVELIQAQLQELADAAGAPLVLLCHEDLMEGQECHRRWFADWWLEQNGIEIPELQPGDLADAAEVQQPRLL